MINLLNVNERPQEFFAREKDRLNEIKQEFPDNETIKEITETSFLDSQFVSSQEKQYIISSEYINAYTIVKISTKVLERFKNWFLEELLEVLSSILNAQVTKDSLYDNNYLTTVERENPEYDYVVSWWLEEGKVFIEQLDTLSIPYTLDGLHDEILLCDYSAKSTAYDSELEKLFSIAELFIWEWKLLEERHPTVERFSLESILLIKKRWDEYIRLSSQSFEPLIKYNDLSARRVKTYESHFPYINSCFCSSSIEHWLNQGTLAFQWKFISPTGGVDVGDRTCDLSMSAA